MKFSDNTLEVLNNYKDINPNMLFKPGKKLRTMNPQKSVVSEANISETIESTAGVYDLSRLLAIMSLCDDPSISFDDKRFVINSKGGHTTHYTYTDESMLIVPPEKNIELKNTIAKVDVKWGDIKQVIKAVGVLQLHGVSFHIEDGDIEMKAMDRKGKGSDDSYTIKLENGTFEDDSSADIFIPVENLKLLPRDYTITLTNVGVVHFHAKDVDYWVAAEV
jgi:hypothetical protein